MMYKGQFLFGFAVPTCVTCCGFSKPCGKGYDAEALHIGISDISAHCTIQASLLIRHNALDTLPLAVLEL
jgi:hypothetical protein